MNGIEMATFSLKYVHSFRDRHGKIRNYFRKDGRRTPLPADPLSEEFQEAYRALLAKAGPDPKPAPTRATAGTFEALVREYYQSAKFKRLKPSTQAEYRRYIEPLRAEHGSKRVAMLEPEHIYRIQDEHQDRPRAADSYIEKMKILCKFAVKRGYRSDNPAREVELLGGGGKEYEPWPAIALERFAHEASPMHRRAFALLLYTGQRRGDVVGMAWQHYQDGKISVVQGKTGKRGLIHVHRNLRAALDVEREHFMMLHTTKGKPFGAVYFGAWFKREMVRLGLQGLQLHGLRKNAVNSLLEAGCSEAETASVTMQSLQVVQHYAKRVNQPRLAGVAIGKWEKAE